MTRRAENQRFALERYHMPPPRRHSSPASALDVLQLAHMMDFGVCCRAAGFTRTRSHSALQLRIVDVGLKRSIIEDCLVLSLQRQAPELDLDGPFSLAFTAHLQTDAAFPVRSNDRCSVLGRDGGHPGPMFCRQGLQEGYFHHPAQSIEVTDIGRKKIGLHDATLLLLLAEYDTGIAFHCSFGAVDGFACALIALARLLNYLSRHTSSHTAIGRALPVGALRLALLIDDLVPEKPCGAFGRIGEERLLLRQVQVQVGI
jgi:hypothetical protein